MDHRVGPLYVILFRQGRKSSNELTLETPTSWLIMTGLVVIVDIIDGFERCCSHSSYCTMSQRCIRPIFWSISLYLGLIKLGHISFCTIGTIWMKNQYSVITSPSSTPQRLHASRSFPVCVIPTYWLVTIVTMDKIHRYQPLSILSQSYLSGDARCTEPLIPPRSHLNLKSSNILPSPPPILIDILHPTLSHG